MGDVIDLIHNLQFNVDTTGVEKLIASLRTSSAVIAEQAEKIRRLEALRDQTDKANLSRISQLSAAIEKIKRQTAEETALIKRKLQENEKATLALQRQLTVLGKLIQAKKSDADATTKISESSNTATLALGNLGRVAQDLPFGFLGIANNLNPLLESFQRLQVESKSTGTSLIKNLTGALTGPAGIGLALSAVSSLLIVFGDDLLNAGKDAESTKDDVEGLTESLNSLVEAQTKYNREVEASVGEGVGKLKREVDELKAKGAASEDIFNAEQKLRQKEKENLQEEEELYARIADAVRTTNGEKKKINALVTSPPGNLPTRALPQLKELIAKAAKEGLDLSESIQSRQTDISEKIKDKEAEISNARYQFVREEGEKSVKAGEKAQKEREKQLQKLKEQAEQYEEILSTFRQATFNDPSEVGEIQADFNAKSKATAEGLKELSDSYKTQLEKEIGPQLSDAESRNLNFQLTERERLKKKEEEEDKKREQRIEKGISKTISAYKVLEDTVSAILDNIYERQISLLDAELETRRAHIGYAVELAKRGNVELLNSEQERITQLEKDREKAAHRQVQVNALVAASNSAVALTEAIKGILTAATTVATEGGGIIGFIGSILAGLAAVGGLYTSIRATADAGQGFAEGVVDIQGPGTAKSDSIRARLSKGESVITAEATAKYAPLLVAMNAGAPIAYTAQMPVAGNSGDIIELRKELRDVKEAIENIHYSSENRVDGKGVYQLHQTTLKQERSRFNH